MERIKKNFLQIIVALTAIFLFVLPFFWFKPGEMDLGGDSSRLYFYDPGAYLKNYALYSVSPSGYGGENIGYFMVPFVLMLLGIKYILHSPTILAAGFHGLNFSIAFLSIYGIVWELIPRKKSEVLHFLSAFLAGLFYMFSQTSLLGWDKVLVTHNQFFLNPFIFFIFLRYFKTNKFFYLFIGLLITFFFAPNFSFVAAPAFFAFYPLSFLFLLIYKARLLKEHIIWKHIIFALITLILLQSFHIIPQVISMLSAGSVLNTTIFSNSGKIDRGLSYFVAVAPNVRVSLNLLLLPQMVTLPIYSSLFIFLPLIILIGFIVNKNKMLLLTASFFLVILFFASANITNIGLNFYKSLFNLPGFSMFRNFYGQWGYALLFFYTILFGQSFSECFALFKKKYLIAIGTLISILLLVTSFSFLNGSLINPSIWQSNNIHIFMRMDPNYQKTLNFLKTLPSDGKVLTLPLSDPGYQIIVNDHGAYQGPSTISYLAGKQDFAGFDEFGSYNQTLSDLVRNNKINDFQDLLGLLNVQYIFYNADPKAYEEGFPNFPYSYVRNFFPQNQNGYKDFLSKLHLTKIYSLGNYFVYRLNDNQYHQTIYATEKINYFPKSIQDWSTPLSISIGRSGDATYVNSVNPAFSANTFSQADPISDYLQVVKNPIVPAFLQHPFASAEPGSILQIPSIIKENYTVKKANKVSDTYIDKRVFYAAKRVAEFEQWGKDIPYDGLFKSFNDLQNWVLTKEDRSLLEVKDWSILNSWDFLLAKYYQYMQESIDKVNTASESNQWKLQQKFLINEYLMDHRKRLTIILSGLEKPDVDREKISSLINSIFNKLLDTLSMTIIDDSSVQYNLPSGIDDKSLLLIQKSPLDQLQDESFQIKQGNQVLHESTSQPENNWIAYAILASNKNQDRSLIIQRENPRNLLESDQFISLENASNDKDISAVLQTSGSFSWSDGLLWKIDDWTPRSYYLLSFDYNTGGNVSRVRVFERDQTSKKQKINVLVDNQLQSEKWRKYQAVVLSGKYANTGYVELGGVDGVDPLSKLEVKNISFTYIPNPNIFLLSQHNNNYQSPSIHVDKINPTKYKIQIANARDPYALVINEAFNNRWKLFLENKGNQKLRIVGLENIRNSPISEATHISSNGYDNVWFINPADTQGKQSYTLIAEMTTQWYFYIGWIISLGAFVFVLIVLMVVFMQKIFFKNEK